MSEKHDMNNFALKISSALLWRMGYFAVILGCVAVSITAWTLF